jgi:ABC-type dipeptide/oligopeptide/nickel transport system permease component
VAAIRHNRWVDYLTMSIALGGVSVPNFVLGPLLILVFALWLGWLPVAGWGPGVTSCSLGDTGGVLHRVRRAARPGRHAGVILQD